MFKLKENREIETGRLILRGFQREDLGSFADIMGEDRVGKQLPRGEGYTYQEVEKWLEGILKTWEEKEYGIWAVEEKNSQQFIGYCGLNRIEELGEFEVLYAYGPDHWKKGFATEAASAVLHYAFKILGLKKVVGLARPDNYGSIKVLEKNGLKYLETMEIFGLTCRYYELESGEYLKEAH